MFQPLFGRVFVDVLEGNDLWWFSQQKRFASSAIICKIPPIPSTRVHHPYWALQHHFQTPQNHILSRFLAFQYNYISINCDICIISMNIAIRYIYIYPYSIIYQCIHNVPNYIPHLPTDTPPIFQVISCNVNPGFLNHG